MSDKSTVEVVMNTDVDWVVASPVRMFSPGFERGLPRSWDMRVSTRNTLSDAEVRLRALN